jgi:hypothetical protein
VRPPRGVPRDEWLLAQAMADGRLQALTGHAFIVGTDRSAALNGYCAQRSQANGWAWDYDEGNPDAYAAGAAFAMAKGLR